MKYCEASEEKNKYVTQPEDTEDCSDNLSIMCAPNFATYIRRIATRYCEAKEE